MTDQTHPGVRISGLGSYLPEKIWRNEDLEQMMDTTAEWIERHTGITARHIAADDETASGMATVAARIALQRAGIAPSDLDLIIACSFTGDYVFPAVACAIQRNLHAVRAGAFDVQANCAGFQIGLNIGGDRMCADTTIKHVLVVGVELQSRYIDWSDRQSAIYFGDGAGAAVLSRAPTGYGFLAHQVSAHGQAFDDVRMRGGGSSFPMRPENVGRKLQYYEINGKAVWKEAVGLLPGTIRRALEKAGVRADEVKLYVMHQANLRLIEYLMARLGQPMSKTYTNVQRVGNTANASAAIALCEAVELGLIQRDDYVVIAAVGAGFIFGASVIRWFA